MKWVAILLVAWGIGATPEVCGAERLNIVLIESDDHHYRALGCMGSEVKTPHLDRLAGRGVLFRNNICQGGLCAPSRNALLTGSYCHNTGVYHNRNGAMPAGTWTFPQALQRSGYHTALIGKNHFRPPALGDEQAAKSPVHALGFEYVHATLGKVIAAKEGPVGNDPYRKYLAEKGLLEKLINDYKNAREGGRSTSIAPSVLESQDYHDTFMAAQLFFCKFDKA